MSCRSLLAFAALALPASAAAQHGAGPGPAPTAPREASQFGFLIGQWELDVRLAGPGGLAERIHGSPRLLGTWKAWRAFDGWGVEDELRLVDRSANPRSLTYTMRAYDPQARRWSLSILDVYRSRITLAEAEWKDGELRQTSRGADGDGKPYLIRARFYEIKPAGFRFQQDRSMDDGKTWKEGTLRIEARRVAATAPR